MAYIPGLEASFTHSENGMIRADMEAACRVASKLDEVIIFRSTGPWAKRWLERGYPSKNFHVKGKSSDWGPHAGLVPYDGTYSKVGYDAAKAANGTAANDKGLKSQFAGKQQLTLTLEEINAALNRPEGSPPRTAVQRRDPILNTKDFFLTARRSGDNKEVVFRAVHDDLRPGTYKIHVFPTTFGTNLTRLTYETPVPLEVMTSGEVGADKPMTGDYDLFAICPSWGQYGSQAAHDIVKPGIRLRGPMGLQPKARFSAGVGMDNVLDPQLHMGGTKRSNWEAMNPSKKALGKKEPGQEHRNEHPDMGNLTPRILRCINALNAEMGAVGSKAPFRRVHHNAESHRHRLFGALTREDMNTVKPGDTYADGFPLTVFQPASLLAGSLPTARYQAVCTLETYLDFRQYVERLYAAGFYVPQSWIWGMPRLMDLRGAV
jgi:hypothetical protein